MAAPQSTGQAPPRQAGGIPSNRLTSRRHRTARRPRPGLFPRAPPPRPDGRGERARARSSPPRGFRPALLAPRPGRFGAPPSVGRARRGARPLGPDVSSGDAPGGSHASPRGAEIRHDPLEARARRRDGPGPDRVRHRPPGAGPAAPAGPRRADDHGGAPLDRGGGPRALRGRGGAARDRTAPPAAARVLGSLPPPPLGRGPPRPFAAGGKDGSQGERRPGPEERRFLRAGPKERVVPAEARPGRCVSPSSRPRATAPRPNTK